MQTTVTSKKIQKTTEKTTENTMPAWAKNARDKAAESRKNLMEVGPYFQGSAGETVRGIFLDSELHEELSKKSKTPMFTIKVMRMSSHKEQTMTILQSMSILVEQLLGIAAKHDWNMKEIVFDAKFKAGNNGNNFLNSIEEVPIPNMTEVA
jgi:hypothetical protein